MRYGARGRISLAGVDLRDFFPVGGSSGGPTEFVSPRLKEQGAEVNESKFADRVLAKDVMRHVMLIADAQLDCSDVQQIEPKILPSYKTVASGGRGLSLSPVTHS